MNCVSDLRRFCRHIAYGESLTGASFSFPVNWNLELSIGDVFKSDDRRYFAAAYRWENQNYVRQSVQNILENHQVPCIPLKGAWLMYVGATPRRPMADLDFLVQKKDFKKVCALFQSAGFQCTDPLHSRFHFHKTYKHSSGVVLELHWHLGLNDFTSIDIADVWQNAKKEAGVWRMQKEHNACHILYHSALHFFDRPDRLFDLAYLYADRSLDWQKVEEIAARWQVLGYVHLAFRLMQKHFDADLPILLPHRNKDKIAQMAERYDHQLIEQVLPLSLKERYQLSDRSWHGLQGLFSVKRILGGGIDRLS